MDDLYAGLRWLSKAPADFRQRCREALASAGTDGRTIARLANYALDENNLRRLAGVIDRLRAEGRSLAPLTPFKLGIVGNGTLEPLVPALVASAARHGIALECTCAHFGQIVQEALDPDSPINRSKPDGVLLALDYRALPLLPGAHTSETASTMVTDAVQFLEKLREGFRSHSGASCIVQTLAPPPEALFGSLDRSAPGTMRNLALAFNAAVAERVQGSHDVFFDVAALAETVGTANWHSPTQWHLAKLPFDAALLPLYADHVARIVGAMRGRSRKCLILDLDNTLWGGVIGDDGLEGINLAQGDATGEAYLDVQRAALALRDRGIVLAVSSKNDDAVARSAFEQHPEMLLREEHVAVFQANWNDKATNIAAIARDLALGLDAMVLLDDNPAERGLVRALLPEVAVPELPENPALYARTLAAAGYFEAVAFSDEDRKRADFYRDNARRALLQGQIGNVDDYIASLKMEIIFRPFDATGRSRIAQLINKSNQFNLTTHRYTEVEVERCEADPTCFTLQVRLVDVFGDNGMIGVVICRERSKADWEIDTWLMSCRVLGRRVEQMVLCELLHHARARGIERLVGTYVPSGRNDLVKDHYGKLGFSKKAEAPDGTTTWTLECSVVVEPPTMRIDRAGFERLPA